MERASCGDYRRERYELLARSRTAPRFVVPRTVPGHARFRNRVDKCPDIAWADFPHTGWCRQGEGETTPCVLSHKDDLASPGRPNPWRFPVRIRRPVPSGV